MVSSLIPVKVHTSRQDAGVARSVRMAREQAAVRHSSEALLQVVLQLRVKGTLRKRMEQVVLLVVEVVDADRGTPMLVDLVMRTHVDDEEALEALVGRGVDVRVVDRRR